MTRTPRAFSTAVLAATLFLPGTAAAEHHEQAAAPAERAVVVGEVIERTGEVVAIDAESRTVIVKGEEGRLIEIQAPEAAANFDKVSVGDVVVARYYESVALAIAPVAGAEPGISELAAVSLAPPGGTPGGVVTNQIQLRAVVNAVDPQARTVTLDTPESGQQTLKVGEGVDLANVKVGEEVSVTFTQALALSLIPQ